MFTSTRDIAERSQYKNTPSDFFGLFADAWSSARGQVLKLETRQSYEEPGNESLDLALAGKWEASFAAIPELRKCDDSLYELVENKKLDFIRCRPIDMPWSDYLRWEMEVYKYNSQMGEMIYCCHRYALEDIFKNNAQHDFMVFDARLAFIHNYNDAGLIQGGWIIDNQNDIRDLISLYGFIKANSQSFHHYLND